MKLVFDFLNTKLWKNIERGYEFEAAMLFPSDTKRPLSFFIPEELGSSKGEIRNSVGDFKPIKVGEKFKAREQMVVMTIKPRRVVVLSSNEINQDEYFEYILVAPINTVKPHEKEKNWYKLLKEDEHPIFTYVPNIKGDRYIDLSQIVSIHKSLLLRKYEEVAIERMDVLEANLLQCLSLGIIEEDEISRN